ncbi:DUF4917 family protein [Longispora sp. NPDC051575]|uniref:DUF4917 family protein n=1 Tax=Longispora sp. NPDC051575 TaxID=3154943 RepID=UPI00342F9511
MVSSTRLYAWADIDSEDWKSLLLGNGFSMNICSGFGYRKLVDKAPLRPSAKQMFDSFDTTNFELVLERIHYAIQVINALGTSASDAALLAAEYNAIREALFAAVGDTHIAHGEIPDETLDLFAQQLLRYTTVFTTNYDLLPYWALMNLTGGQGFTDLFRSSGNDLVFDSTVANWNSGWTTVLYLHGGLHLWRDEWTGITGKWRANREAAARLLDGLEGRYADRPDRQPLLVSEGTSSHKNAAIQRSGYLSFALQRLISDTAPLVVLGFSFSNSDKHIVDAIKAGASGGWIAIGLHVADSTSGEIARDMAALEVDCAGRTVVFFDAATHPLTASSLRVK